MKLFIRTMLLMLSVASWASAQTRNFNTPALAGYMGADREKLLFEGAKPEGKVVWYTSLSGGSYKALAEAFKAKYPGVEIEVYRRGRIGPSCKDDPRGSGEAKYRGCLRDYPRHPYILGRGQAP